MSRVKVATIEVFAELGEPLTVELRAPGPNGKPVSTVVNVRRVDERGVKAVDIALRPALLRAIQDALQLALPHTRR